jgi:catechol 2,3-dioxygenase-like lactoylglutathione lyase family enzyme
MRFISERRLAVVRSAPVRVERSGAPMHLDHLILAVNDVDASICFFADILGLRCEGQAGPFSVIRVSPEATLQLAPWGTTGGEHLAFAMSPHEFEAVFTRIRVAGIAYGDSFHEVGNGRGPGREVGAQGMGASLYGFDPNQHLIEIRHYGEEAVTAPV